MVAQEGYSPVGPVVGEDFGRNAVVGWRRAGKASERLLEAKCGSVEQ